MCLDNDCVHLEKLLERKKYMKSYYENNKGKIKLQTSKKYFENHELKKQQIKKYQEDHKGELNEKYNKKCECECGSIYSFRNKGKHLKTEKHKKYIENPNLDNKIIESKNDKHNCECGGRYTHRNKSTHEKSKKHKQYLDSLLK